LGALAGMGRVPVEGAHVEDRLEIVQEDRNGTRLPHVGLEGERVARRGEVARVPLHDASVLEVGGGLVLEEYLASDSHGPHRIPWKTLFSADFHRTPYSHRRPPHVNTAAGCIR